ncbi:MAG: hypothetical protein MK116_04570 [Phycisphaerales bacterium]|nr:hypothetical protein [Phycisphaerales bacterium]
MSQSAGIRKADRFAVIDVGSNSVKLSIAVRGRRRPAVIETARIVSQLGQQAQDDGTLDPEALERTAEAIAQLAEEARSQDATVIRAVATSAAREAPNAEAFRERVQALAGIDLEIIPGEREAELVFRAVSSSHLVKEQNSIVFDTGGGSTEIVVATNGEVDHWRSVPLGALRLAEEFDATGRVGSKVMEAIRDHVREVVSATGLQGGPADILVGTGGTCTALALLDIGPLPMARGSKPPSILREQHTMSKETIETQLTWLRRMETSERKAETGLRTRRAEIIVAGVCIVAELMAIFDLEWVTMFDVGLRDGLLIEMMDQAGA